MGMLLCEQNFRDVWIRNKSVRAEIGQILRTHKHTHTTAAKLVVRMFDNGRQAVKYQALVQFVEVTQKGNWSEAFRARWVLS